MTGKMVDIDDDDVDDGTIDGMFHEKSLAMGYFERRFDDIHDIVL